MAKNLGRKSLEHFASWPELECEPGQQPPSAGGPAAPSIPLGPPEPGGRGRQHSLQPLHAARGESGYRKAIAWDAPACPTFLLNIAGWVLPLRLLEPARERLSLVQLALPRDAEPTAVPPSATVPIPQPQRHLSHPCLPDPWGQGAGGTQGTQPDGWMGMLPAAAPSPPMGSQPQNRWEDASLALAAAGAASAGAGTVPLTAAAAGRQRRMKRQSGARHARSLSPSASQTAREIRRLCRGRATLAGGKGTGEGLVPSSAPSPDASCPQQLAKEQPDGSMTARCSGCRGIPGQILGFLLPAGNNLLPAEPDLMHDPGHRCSATAALLGALRLRVLQQR